MAKIKHIAFFKFKETTTPEQVDQFFDQILDLSENLPGIENFISGPNNSPENLNQGYSHAMIMTFEDSSARDGYVNHADHQAFVAANLPLVENVAVLDFEM